MTNDDDFLPRMHNNVHYLSCFLISIRYAAFMDHGSRLKVPILLDWANARCFFPQLRQEVCGAMVPEEAEERRH